MLLHGQVLGALNVLWDEPDCVRVTWRSACASSPTSPSVRLLDTRALADLPADERDRLPAQ